MYNNRNMGHITNNKVSVLTNEYTAAENAEVLSSNKVPSAYCGLNLEKKC